ncbi:MAG: sigma-70 family RNA polymerase sigma factor [bacterium]
MRDELDLTTSITGYIQGDDTQGDVLADALRPPVTRAVDSFLGPDDISRDDIIQDSLVTVLGSLRENLGFQGNLIQYTVTIARNRCRNIYNWRKRWAQTPEESQIQQNPAAGGNPLDLLLEDEVQQLMQKALTSLSRECRDLLTAYYLRGESLEQIRARVGLNSIQALYYHKKICLKSAFRFLKTKLAVTSMNGTGRT